MAQIKQGRWVTPAGQGVSSALELGTESLVGLYTPAAIDAAALKLQASHDGQAFVDIVSDGSPVTIQPIASAYVALDATKLLGAAQIRVAHLDGGGAPTTETAERVLLPVFRTFE
jgi:hypothetical protein